MWNGRQRQGEGSAVHHNTWKEVEWGSVGGKEGTGSRGLQAQVKASDSARDRGRASVVWEYCRGGAGLGRFIIGQVPALLLAC